MVFCLVQKKNFGQHKNQNIYFFLLRKARNFFPVFNIRLYDKNSESYIFFSSTKIRIFFSATLEIRIYFQKKNITPPFKLNGRSLNDLEQFFVENNVNDLENIRNMCSENLNIFVKPFSLLYADDTIILSETEADMQYALAIFGKSCHHWKLKVNLQKTKVIIFCKTK